MPVRYRIMIGSIGALVCLAGALSLLNISRLPASSRAGAVVRGVIAAGIGVAFIVGAYRNRAPGWLSRD